MGPSSTGQAAPGMGSRLGGKVKQADHKGAGTPQGEFAASPALGQSVAPLGPAGGGEVIHQSRRPPGGLGLAACPMAPRSDKRRAGSTERQERRARAGLGKTGETQAGGPGWSGGGGREPRRGGQGWRPEGPRSVSEAPRTPVQVLPRWEMVASFGGEAGALRAGPIAKTQGKGGGRSLFLLLKLLAHGGDHRD